MKYKRVLLKLSGEALMGDQNYGIDPQRLDQYALEILETKKLGIELAIVIGGGNIYRGVYTRLMSGLSMEQVCEPFIRRKAIRHLEKGRIVIFGAGLGKPYFTTDSTASLRAIEIEADVVLKGTRVDGVYSADPEKDPNAIKFSKISFNEVFERNLNVMDMTAFTLCQENNLPIMVFDMNQKGNLIKIIEGQELGTLIN